MRTNDDAREPAGPEHATRVPGVGSRSRYSRASSGRSPRVRLSSSRLTFRETRLAPRFDDMYERLRQTSFRDTSRRRDKSRKLYQTETLSQTEYICISLASSHLEDYAAKDYFAGEQRADIDIYQGECSMTFRATFGLARIMSFCLQATG